LVLVLILLIIASWLRLDIATPLSLLRILVRTRLQYLATFAYRNSLSGRSKRYGLEIPVWGYGFGFLERAGKLSRIESRQVFVVTQAMSWFAVCSGSAARDDPPAN
jgi:hypothetical protein